MAHSMLLACLMLLGLSEGKDLQRREHTSVNMADLKSLASRDVEKIEKLAGNLADLRDKISSRSLHNAAVAGVLDWFPWKQEAERDVKQQDKLQEERSLPSSKKLDWFPWKKEAERDVKQQDKLQAERNLLSSNLLGLFPWKHEAERDVKLQDQLQKARSFLSSNVLDWFPWKQEVERDVKQTDQIHENVRKDSPDHILDTLWFPLKQDFSKAGRDVQERTPTKKSENVNGHDLKGPFRDLALKKISTAEASKRQLLSKLNAAMERETDIMDNRERSSVEDRRLQQRFSVKKVGNCYFVCDDVCDPICHPVCERIC